MERSRRRRFWKGFAIALAVTAIAAPAAQAVPLVDGYGDVVVATPPSALTDAADRSAPSAIRVSAAVSTGDRFAWPELGLGIALGLAGSALLASMAIGARRGRLAHS